MADFYNDNSNRILKVMDNPPYQIDNTDASNVYMRYKSGLGPVLIVKVNTAANIVTYTKTLAAWVDRAAEATVYVPIDA